MTTRHIGLSLGADLCWPIAYETLIEQLDLDIEVDGERLTFDVERVHIEPFDLRQGCKYDVVVDRLTHWFHISREWIKKITLMDGTYVLNNPYSLQSMEKHTSYCAMIRLGMPIPETWMIPPKKAPEAADTVVTVKRYSKLFDLGSVGDKVGWPAFLKPYDGGGWVGVRRVTDAASLHEAYDDSGAKVNHLQAAVKDWDLFVRAVGIGPQVNVIRYDPDKPLHGRYCVDYHFMDGDQWLKAQRTARVINAFFGWDFNSCEMLRTADGELQPIDFANACPDSQVTSLHFHFPWLVTSLIRWTVFCAATKRPFRQNLDWQPFFDIADQDLTFDEKLVKYDELAQEHFETERFKAFCDEHLTQLDELAVTYFSSDEFRAVVKEKVTSLYPAHEVAQFTEHFFGLVRFWVKTERDRLGLGEEA
jgi:hypothetical protein